jgi:cytochrome c biogenesis protein CcmG/thiol:disulfide interchange protein DsbE
VGAVVVGVLALLWFGLAQRERGTVGEATVPFKTAPSFTLGLFDGSSLSLDDTLASGKPVVVNFWASWCAPCQDEAPVLEAAWRREQGGVTFVGVDVEDIDADAQSFLAKYNTTYPNGSGGAGPISVSYGMRGVPETYFIAPDRTVVRKWNGPLTAAGLDQFLAELKTYSGSLGR